LILSEPIKSKNIKGLDSLLFLFDERQRGVFMTTNPDVSVSENKKDSNSVENSFSQNELKRIEILNGNEIIIQGGLEAGFNLYTGYPGSPLADYFNILHHRKAEFADYGIKVVIANSEANAAAMASGAKQAGRDCLVAMKSMGLHVASDALSVGNFANPGDTTTDASGNTLYPGVVIAVGDDPWSISTSTPADSRFLFKHLHIPFLEPSNPQELKDWMSVALHISKRTSVYQGLLLTTYMAEGGGRVEVSERAEVQKELSTLDPAKFDLSRNVMVPPNSLKADITMIEERFPRIQEVLKEMSLDKTLGTNSDIGFISSGVIFETLKQALEAGDYLDRYGLYKVAASYPLVDELLVPWLKGLKSLIVVEEKRGFLESELKELCQRHNIEIQILGKKFGEQVGFVAHGGLSFELVSEKIQEALIFCGETPCSGTSTDIMRLTDAMPKRLPTFCPGCPHRETLSLLKDLRKTLKDEGVDLITHGDVGCYSLSFLPPFKEMHNLSAMGQGGALGAGLDIFTDNPSVVLMGDSTFFHSGITDISNSVQANHNITYILLDNDNTAMTGHQMTPASGMNVEGRIRPRQDMLNSVHALGVDYATEVNPSDRYFYKSLLVDVVKRTGVKVIVSNKECALTFHGRKKRQDRKIFAKNQTVSQENFFQINTDACEDCRACVESTGCPGLGQIHDAYGTKVVIDPQICVGDSYCTKIKACPSFEEVIVKNYHPTLHQKSATNNLDEVIGDIPEPDVKKTLDQIAQGNDWRMVVTGVGGSGVTTISRVVAEAAREMDGRQDLDFKFVDQKGLAQRNGNVTGHLSIFNKSKSYGAVTPLGSADVLVSPDLLDGSGHIHFIGKTGECIFDKRFQIPLSLMLDNGEKKEPVTEAEIKRKLEVLLGDQVSFFDMKELSQRALGKSVYASAMILGICYQAGRLPFSLKNMRDSFVATMPKIELENNWHAFNLGRKCYIDGDKDLLNLFKVSSKKTREQLLDKSVEESLLPWINKKVILGQYRSQVEKMVKMFPEIKRKNLAQYMHDLYIYDRGSRAPEFMQKAGELKEYFRDSNDLIAMGLRVLAKTYFVKDEVFVSHAMISPQKIAEDKARFGHLGTGYKIVRINRPAFEILGKKIEFDISPKTWMLKIMRHMRLLRLFLRSWHSTERKIGSTIRKELLETIPKLKVEERREALKKLENVKGYREFRYENARKYSVLS
jgi:indolepyruvate ferredoxin oxidoreductase